MRPLTESAIRRSFVNGSRGDAAKLTLPRDFGDLDWAELDFLGWRDPRAPLRGVIVSWRGDEPVGVLLRAPESRMTRRVSATCMLCHTSRSGSDISLFVAPRTGPQGRNGDTVGTYICADLGCSRTVRVERASATLQPDPGRTVEERVAALNDRLRAFVDEVRGAATR